MSEILLGLSPCPNDTFIFHALLHQLVKPDFPDEIEFRPVFGDVEKLNSLAIAGELPFTKVSAGVLPAILDKYAILNAGSALGWGCGPLLVARDSNIDAQRARIAIPGKYTTASLLLDLHGRFTGLREEMLFSEIMPAVKTGAVDAGVIIHEGRFVYGDAGLKKIIDFGEWWEDTWKMPLPLGVIVVRRDVAPYLAKAVDKAIAASIRHGRKQPQAAQDFISAHAQELDPEVTQKHIDTFVTDFSLNLGKRGKSAILSLLASKIAINQEKIFLNS